MHVGSLRVYPVKSTRGIEVDEAAVERAGLAQDRRWAVVDDEGNRLTARTHPRLFGVTATPGDDGLHLRHADQPSLGVPLPTGGPVVPIRISRLDHAVDAGEPAARWFSTILGEAVRLVWQDDPGQRPVSPDHGGLPGDPLSLADAGPLLLTTTASADRLGTWTAEAGAELSTITTRMRPNVVVDEVDEPFAEDRWRRVRIGEVDYRFADHCDRCVMTTIDPDSLQRGPEPIRTLARHRKWGGKTWFGIWLVPLRRGRIRVGDTVTPAP